MTECAYCIHGENCSQRHPYGSTTATENYTLCTLREEDRWDEREYGEWDDDFMWGNCPAYEEAE